MNTVEDITHLQRYGLFGRPVEHSLSPAMFNAAFKETGQHAEYAAFSVSPKQLQARVNAARNEGFMGFNVTMPLKEKVLAFLDRVEGDAKTAGSVNTVALRGSGLVGYNTDGEGFMRALATYNFDPSDRSILILGAGGAARAIIVALSDCSSHLAILNRNIDRARKVVDCLRGKTTATYSILDRHSIEEQLESSDLVVNATPLSTNDLLEACGVDQTAIPSSTTVFDLAYAKQSRPNPVSERSDRQRISPLELLLQQALLSYVIWTGVPAPRDVMRQALLNQNGSDWRDTIS